MKKSRRRTVCVLMMLLVVLVAHTKTYAVGQTKFLRYLTRAAEQGNVYEVRQDGLGEFTSIQEGVDYAESGDTLIIYPGIYEENVMIIDKEVNLMGISQEACVLTANADNYHHIPLTIGAGMVYNMTICATSTHEDYTPVHIPKDVYESGDTALIYEWQDKFPGYAVHIDQDYSNGRELLIEDCRIFSDTSQCIGIGYRPDSRIVLTGCDLFAKAGGGCIYLHNALEPLSGESEFIMKNCRLKNYHSPYVMSLQSVGDTNSVYMTFQNVKVSTVAYESMESYNTTNLNTWYDVDQLENFAVKGLLNEGSYYSSLNSELVHHYTESEHRELKEQLQEQDCLLDDWPSLAEGINYLETKLDTENEMMQKKEQLSTENKRRFVINIQNENQEIVGDGWCGLSHIYLTEQSYGNTLIEMNYPRVAAE